MRYLVDTSVLARARQDVVGERLATLAEAGQLWTCRLIDLVKSRVQERFHVELELDLSIW